MLTTIFWFFFDRSETFFQPFDGLGVSAKPMLVRSVSIVTGTPGSVPVNVPDEALEPLIVTTAFLSNFPDHISMPDDGPVYRAAVAAGGTAVWDGVWVTGAGG